MKEKPLIDGTIKNADSIHLVAAFVAPIIGAAVGAAVGMLIEASWANKQGLVLARIDEE